jgi:hypothetical protein
MTAYFFHNVYGDEQQLLQTLPDGVVAVPFGWTEEVEQNRNALLADLNTSVSSIPCLLFFVPEHFVDASMLSIFDQVPRDHRSVGLQKVPAKWVEYSFAGMPKPWTWDALLQAIRSDYGLVL